MILQVIMLILLLGAAPLGAGLLVNRGMAEENRSTGMTYICGFLLLLAAFELITVPIVFTDPWGFGTVIRIFTIVMTLMSGMGIIMSLHLWRRGERIWQRRASFSSMEKKERGEWLLSVVLILFQLFMAVTHASFDGDDAYYVVQSVITDETDTLYRILPYTGLSTNLDMRHSMAVFPIWISYVARLAGIHAAILCHSILPVVLIPLTYAIYYEIGKKLFPDKRQYLPSYMIFVSLLHIFGNVSIYTNATFLLMRTWQGKSMLANVIIPAVFLFLLCLFEGEPDKRKKQPGLWGMLLVINVTAAMMSTASVFLNPILLMVMAVVFFVREKNKKIILQMALCCLPCVVYGMLYVLL